MSTRFLNTVSTWIWAPRPHLLQKTTEPIAQLAEHVFVTERSVAQFPGGVVSPTRCSRSLKFQTTTNPYNTCMPPLQEISAHFPQQENQSPRVAHS